MKKKMLYCLFLIASFCFPKKAYLMLPQNNGDDEKGAGHHWADACAYPEKSLLRMFIRWIERKKI